MIPLATNIMYLYLIPYAKRIQNIIKAITSTVPKSGCLIIRIIGIAQIAMNFKNPFNAEMRFSLISAKEYEAIIIIAIFANSEGCNDPMTGNLIHLSAPQTSAIE